MKEGYVIRNFVSSSDRFFTVSNYEGENEIYLWGYDDETLSRTSSDVGIWKIKQLKSK